MMSSNQPKKTIKMSKKHRKVSKVDDIDNVNFYTYIHRVLNQVHPDTGMSGNSMDSINNMMRFVLLRIVRTALRYNNKETVDSSAIQIATRLELPGELTKHAVSEGSKAVMISKENPVVKGAKRETRSKRAKLQFSVSRVENVMRSMGAKRISSGAAIYLAAVLEYLCAEILELAGNAARDSKKKRISERSILLTIKNDDELECLFRNAVIAGGVIPSIHSVILPKKKVKKMPAKTAEIDACDY